MSDNTVNNFKMVIVYNHADTLLALTFFFRDEAHIHVDVVGTACSARQLLSGIQDQWEPDIILIDKQLPYGIDGLEATRMTLAARPQVKVLMLDFRPKPSSGLSELELLKEIQQSGATGCFFKDPWEYRTLEEMVLAVASGVNVLAGQIAELTEH